MGLIVPYGTLGSERVKIGQRLLFVTDMVTILSYLSPFIRLTGVDGPWLRQNWELLF